MLNDDFLKLNPRKMIRCLSPILPESELEKIKAELKKNVDQLIRLGDAHLRYAKNLNGQNVWRQRVSRAYYSCYSASKAIRLGYSGFFSSDASDHKKIGDLPDDFPDKSIWENRLTKFRGDRNIADYDHVAKERVLEFSSAEYLDLASSFMKEVKKYLKEKHSNE